VIFYKLNSSFFIIHECRRTNDDDGVIKREK